MSARRIKNEYVSLLKLFVGLVLGFVLDVENWRQVAVLELYVLDEELGLSLG